MGHFYIFRPKIKISEVFFKPSDFSENAPDKSH